MPTPRDVLIEYGENYMTRPIPEPKQPIQDWNDLLATAKELAEGVFSIMINENFGMYLAWENMGPEEEKRVKHLMAEYLEKEILERF